MTIEVDGWARFAPGDVLALPMIIQTTGVKKSGATQARGDLSDVE